MSTKLQWATDPNIEQNNYWNELIIYSLSSSKFHILNKSTINLQNGVNLYTYEIIQNNSDILTLPNGYIVSTIDNILGMIEKISYISIEFSFLEIEITQQKIDINTNLQNCQTNITAYLKNYLDLDVDHITTSKFIIDFEKGSLVHKFIPFFNDHRIYTTSKNNAKINRVCDLNKLIGYRFLSDNSLMKVIIDKYLELEPEFPKQNIKIDNNLFLCKCISQTDLIHFEQLQNLYLEYKNQGYFTIPNKLNNLEHTLFEDLYPEIALAWQIKLIDSWKHNDLNHIYCFQTTDYLIDNVDYFMQQSAQRIISNKIPIFNFSNSWCQILNLYDEIVWLKFLYLLIQSYTQLITEHPILFNYLDSVILNPDFTISACFCNKTQFLQFQQILNKQFQNNSISVTKSDIIPSNNLIKIAETQKISNLVLNNLLIESTLSLVNALTVRWYWHNKNRNSNSIIIQHHNKYYIVIDNRSNNNINYNNEIDKLTYISTDDFNKMKQKLIDEMNQDQINEDEEMEAPIEIYSETETDMSDIQGKKILLKINEPPIPNTLAEIQTDNIFNKQNDIDDLLIIKQIENENVLLKKYQNDFITNLRHHYINCRNDQDIITKEQISKMDIVELLSIIVMQYEDEYHCFSQDYLLKTGIYVDPATGISLNERIVRIMKQQEFGIRGYFSYAILPGVLEDVPELPLLNIEKASVDVNVVNDENIINSNYLTIDLLTNIQNLVERDFYEQNMTQEYTLTIAEIDMNILSKSKNKMSSEKIEQFAIKFADLWKQGKLLSDWSFDLLLNFGKISRRSFREPKLAIMANENSICGQRFINKIMEME